MKGHGGAPAFVPDPVRSARIPSGRRPDRRAARGDEGARASGARADAPGHARRHGAEPAALGERRLIADVGGHAGLARAAGAGGWLVPGARRRDSRVEAVLGNVEAMERAMDVGAGVEIGVGELFEIHRLCTGPPPIAPSPGSWRRQKRIGSNAYDPLEAASCRPRPRSCRSCSTISAASLPAATCRRSSRRRSPTPSSRPSIPSSTATVVPGRALICAVLRRRGEVTKGASPPISLLLAAGSGRLVCAGLTGLGPVRWADGASS